MAAGAGGWAGAEGGDDSADRAPRVNTALPAKPPLEVSTGLVLTLGAGAPVADLANEQEAYITAVMEEVTRQEAAAGAGCAAGSGAPPDVPVQCQS